MEEKYKQIKKEITKEAAKIGRNTEVPKLNSNSCLFELPLARDYKQCSTVFKIVTPLSPYYILNYFIARLASQAFQFYYLNLFFMNMYVANLSFAVGEKELSELFAAFGEVSSVKIITDRETGRSRGFAFVEMSSDEEAKTAMAALNNKEVGGRPLAVSEARKKTDNDNRFSGRGRSGNSKW